MRINPPSPLSLLPIALAVAALATPTAADARRGDYEKCATTSDYSLQLSDNAAIFANSGKSHEIRFEPGRLIVDGREIALSAADRERVREYERTLRRMIPEVKDIAVEAVGIAFTAIEQIARSFVSGSELDAAVDRLSRKQADAVARIGDSFANRPFNDAEFEKLVETTVEQVVPEVAALAAGAAVRAALSGEAMTGELEARLANLEKTIEAEVETRAKSLEARAEALCGSLHELDRLESAMAVQIDGEPLDLIRLDD